MYNGVDMSKWQASEKIDYDKLTKGLDFAILRLCYRSNSNRIINIDTEFMKHYSELKKRGVSVGAYIFSTAETTEEAKEEAQFMLDYIRHNQLELDYPIYIDTESSGGIYGHEHVQDTEVLTSICETFCDVIEKRGFFAGIYCNEWWLNNELIPARLVGRYTLWIAKWDPSPPRTKCDIWQYTSDGRLDGYAGRLDLNRGYRDLRRIIRENQLNGFSKPVNIVAQKITITYTDGTTKDIPL